MTILVRYAVHGTFCIMLYNLWASAWAIFYNIHANVKLYIKGSVSCTVPVSDIKSLVHRIAFFALIRFKYSNLTPRIQSQDGTENSSLDFNAEGWNIDSPSTRFLKMALESYFASKFFFLL